MLFLNKTWHYGYLKMSNVVCQVNLNITCFLQDLLFSWICWKWNWKFNFLKLFYLLSLALRHFVTLTEYGPHCGCQLFHLVVNWLISTHLQLLLRHPSKSHMRIIKLLWGRTEQTVLLLSNPSLSFCATVSLITAAAVTWFLEYFFFSPKHDCSALVASISLTLGNVWNLMTCRV